MPLESVLSRRAVPLGAAGAGALPVRGAAHAGVPPSKRFDLTTPSPTLLWRKPLRSGTWLMRSFAWDDTRQEIYFLQVEPGSTTGDLIVTRTAATGRHLGWMVLRGFGHGVSLGVEPYKGAVYLWTESKDDTLLHRADLRSERRGAFHTRAGRSLLKDKREPEGIAVRLVSGRPRLVFGFSSGSAPNRRTSLFYKSSWK